MGRNRTPSSVLELTGSFKKHPDRKKARASEPAAIGPLGLPPTRLDAELKKIWYEITDMIPAGVLAKSDRLAIEIACRLTRKVFRDEINGAELSTLNSLLARLGMTPADRSKVSVPKQAEEQDEIAALAAEMRGADRPN
jgi:phage terminase small subunit